MKTLRALFIVITVIGAVPGEIAVAQEDRCPLAQCPLGGNVIDICATTD
jgi:hypothetical protein